MMIQLFPVARAGGESPRTNRFVIAARQDHP
jgi:hypothetical protein